jgi:hypothetical protein
MTCGQARPPFRKKRERMGHPRQKPAHAVESTVYAFWEGRDFQSRRKEA